MRARRVASLLIVLSSVSFLSAAEPLYHLLAKGETLFAIARIYGVSPEAIEGANGISDPGKLKVGQRLLIPQVHRVEKGETLYGIARSAGINITELRRINGLTEGAIIRVGDNIYLPTSGSSPRALAISPSTTTTVATIPIKNLQAPKVTSTADTKIVDKDLSPATDASNKQPAAPGTTGRLVSTKASLPCPGEARYLDGKLFGIAINSSEGVQAKAVASGTVVSAGPYRGFGAVAFVQSKSGLIYVYGGNSSLDVKLGDLVKPGQAIGRVGRDSLGGSTYAYFFVFKGGVALDPTQAPRD